jgi:hypothetical protein
MENIVLYKRISSLPNPVKEEVLDYMEFLIEKKRKQDTADKTTGESSPLPQRKLGLLENRGSFRIKENFEKTDEELLSV